MTRQERTRLLVEQATTTRLITLLLGQTTIMIRDGTILKDHPLVPTIRELSSHSRDVSTWIRGTK